MELLDGTNIGTLENEKSVQFPFYECFEQFILCWRSLVQIRCLEILRTVDVGFWHSLEETYRDALTGKDFISAMISTNYALDHLRIGQFYLHIGLWLDELLTNGV